MSYFQIKLRRTKQCPCSQAGKTGRDMWNRLRGATILVSKIDSRPIAKACGAKKYYLLADDDIFALRQKVAKKHKRDESSQASYWICDHVVLREVKPPKQNPYGFGE